MHASSQNDGDFSISAFLSLYKLFPDVARDVKYMELFLFVRLIAALKVQIAPSAPAHPPQHRDLRRRFHIFFKEVFRWDGEKVKKLWSCFRVMGWSYQEPVEVCQLAPLVTRYGLKYDIGMF